MDTTYIDVCNNFLWKEPRELISPIKLGHLFVIMQLNWNLKKLNDSANERPLSQAV